MLNFCYDLFIIKSSYCKARFPFWSQCTCIISNNNNYKLNPNLIKYLYIQGLMLTFVQKFRARPIATCQILGIMVNTLVALSWNLVSKADRHKNKADAAFPLHSHRCCWQVWVHIYNSIIILQEMSQSSDWTDGYCELNSMMSLWGISLSNQETEKETTNHSARYYVNCAGHHVK